MATKTVNLPVQIRSMDAMPASINEETRTLEVVWTTETPVERWDFWSGERYMEVLDLGEVSVNMERMTTRAPLLDSHTQWGTDGVIGVVERAWIENRQGLAVVRFLKDDERADKVWNKVRQGVLNKISVGYSIEEFEESYDNGVRTLRAVRWTPLEISIVAVPADNDAAVRSADKRASACVIKSRANTKKSKPKQFKRKEHKKMKKRFKRQIEDLAPEQLAEVAGIVDDEAEQINTAVEEAVTALDALETEVPAEVTAIVENLAETVDNITTDTETQINEIMDDDEEPPPAGEGDGERAAQILDLCETAGVSVREARTFIKRGYSTADVARALLKKKADEFKSTRGKNDDGKSRVSLKSVAQKMYKK